MTEIGEIRHGHEIDISKQPSAKYVYEICPKCSNARWHLLVNKGAVCKNCKYLSGEDAPYWKGGRRINKEGYVFINIRNDKFFLPMAYAYEIKEHRYVMAKHLGRCLASWEFVHHKNGNRQDNRLENLELVTSGQHMRDHSKGYRDGYNKGYKDASNKRINELEAYIRQLKDGIHGQGDCKRYIK